MSDATRYDRMPYRRVGRSGLVLPAVSLGLWHNFGSVDPFENARAMVLRAFDLGVTHFDLANNYGPAPGSAEETFGRVLHRDLRGHRDELIVSTKAGWPMWPGPYGDGGSRKYLLASLDASLRRMKLEYVDIFYHHRPDPDTPLEESMRALDQAVRQGKALYVGISSYDTAGTAAALAILRDLGTPFIIHQPRYSMLDRTIEGGLLDLLAAEGIGCIVFSPLAQGLLTDRYLHDVPPDSRAANPDSELPRDAITDDLRRRVTCLAGIAERRGQSIAQLAIAWTLRHDAVTSAVIGASRLGQLEANLAAAHQTSFTDDELEAIDRCLAS
ncbi:MAG TPA: aldo/keto reductase [Longimicrobiales bacterium]|nr:aldo/keto reductase [Longimicrobiales bacterium]